MEIIYGMHVVTRPIYQIHQVLNLFLERLSEERTYIDIPRGKVIRHQGLLSRIAQLHIGFVSV